MSTKLQPKSIRDLPPLERGGVEARQGFEFQDHVAASLLIQMLERNDLLEVWCETHDDITLIWQGINGEEVEFVQVKALTLDQLWSIAKLTDRKRKKKKAVVGSSILERSLANDGGSEPSQFRLTTTLPPNNDLSFLQLRFDTPDRVDALKKSHDLIGEIEKKIGQVSSGKGNGVKYWLEHTMWEVHQEEASLEAANKLALQRVVLKLGYHLLPDQLDELYADLLALARKAGIADWGDSPSDKKIGKPGLEQWLKNRIESRIKPPTTGGVRLKTKLEKACINPTDIEECLGTRHLYLAERYKPKYLSTTKLTAVELEVSATLHTLRARLDAGVLEDDGVKFHAQCLTAIEQLRGADSVSVPLAILQGCMYNIADRCVHRFRRATV